MIEILQNATNLLFTISRSGKKLIINQKKGMCSQQANQMVSAVHLRSWENQNPHVNKRWCHTNPVNKYPPQLNPGS